MDAKARANTVAVVGASENPARYSNRALRMLQANGFTPIPISRSGKSILGVAGYPSLTAIPGPVDTVTIYLSPERQDPVIRDLLALAPRRAIFNPGAENPPAAALLRQHGIETLEACTLVLLSTGQF
jgi:uncharacterized protein